MRKGMRNDCPPAAVRKLDDVRQTEGLQILAVSVLEIGVRPGMSASWHYEPSYGRSELARIL
jgi:hypothetical protein